MSGFKKRIVSSDRVALVEAAAAGSTLIRDPRLLPLKPVSDEINPILGSSQGLESSKLAYEIGRVYDVPLGEIKSNPFNPRYLYTNTAIDEMATSLTSGGQKMSATGFIDEFGTVVLIEGETRLRGCRAGGLPTLRIEIKTRPNSDAELYEEARTANVERRDQTPLDDAIKWKELLAKKVYPSQSGLAKALKLGEDHVSRVMSLNELPSKVIHAAAENPGLLSLKMLNAIREYFVVKGEECTLELIFEAGKHSLGYRDVVARRKAAEKGPVKRKRSTKEALVFNGVKGELKTFEEGGRLELSLKGLSPEDTEEIRSKIRTVFQNT